MSDPRDQNQIKATLARLEKAIEKEASIVNDLARLGDRAEATKSLILLLKVYREATVIWRQYPSRKDVACLRSHVNSRIKKAFAYPLVAGVVVTCLIIGGSQRRPAKTDIPPQESVRVAHPLAFCSPGLQGWVVEAAKTDSAHTSNGVDGVIGYGSRDGKQAILYRQEIPFFIGKGRSEVAIGIPMVYIGDDPYWITKVSTDWTRPDVLTYRRHDEVPQQVIDVSSAKTVGYTRLVLVMHRKRAAQFAAGLQSVAPGSTPASRHTWGLVRLLALKGWSVLTDAKDSAQSHVLIPNPEHYHSGLAAIILMHEEYARNNDDFRDVPSFSEFLRPIASKAMPRDIEDKFVSYSYKRPGIFDETALPTENEIAVCYESDAFQLIQEYPDSDLQVVYPNPTMVVSFFATRLYRNDEEDKEAETLNQSAKSFTDSLAAGLAHDTFHAMGLRATPAEPLLPPRGLNIEQYGFANGAELIRLIVPEKNVAATRRATLDAVMSNEQMEYLPFLWASLLPPPEVRNRNAEASVGK